MTETAYPTEARSLRAEHPTQHELRRLQRLVREQLAGAVVEGRLDVDLANSMLECFGLAQLPRRWSVRIALAFTCEITAGNQDDAFAAAADAIEAALNRPATPLDVDWDGREDVNATVGEVDPEALHDA